jgi:hypothetical protein
MRRRVAVLLGFLAIAATAPVAAAQPPPGSCGLGRELAHEAIADPTGPGASEVATISPLEVGCTGKPNTP